MKNKAKCKLCQSIIESFHSQDYVECRCGEISVDCGNAFRCSAKSWDNFLRIDDNGNEIAVKSKDDAKELLIKELEISTKPRYEYLLEQLHSMVESIEALPPHAMTLPITHYDFLSLILVLEAILRCDCNNANCDIKSS